MASASNENEQTSHVDNRGAKYESVGSVYNAPVSHQTIVQEKAVTYDVDRRDVDTLERWSMFVVEKIGESRVRVAVVLTILFGGGTVASSVYEYPTIVASFAPAPLYAGIVLIAVGAALLVALQYKYESRCVKCNTFYAMKETGDPTEREVRVKGGVRRTTTRSYRCEKCGHQTTKKINRLVENEPSV